VKLADLAAKWKSKGLLFAFAAATTMPTQNFSRAARGVHLHERKGKNN
jgi:hypothetical protein